MKYIICPCCGATLDPGERCDCERDDNRDTENDKEATNGAVKRKHQHDNSAA